MFDRVTRNVCRNKKGKSATKNTYIYVTIRLMSVRDANVLEVLLFIEKNWRGNRCDFNIK